ncbi:hypothetical protein [Parasphingorhabdus flavimaris]|uniref:hypothetical protein n=1 Tax=Parasphingorhabdus flavimaris TaxID=266812 RepID=UPI003002C223
MTIRHGLLFRTILAIVLVLLAMFATTRVASQITSQTGEMIQTEASLLDMAFYAGNEIRIKASSEDDIFAAGDTIRVDATTADHLILAGGEIDIKDIEVDDIIAAGGDLDLRSGSVRDDVIAAGGMVTLHPALQVAGSAIVSGGEVRINAPIRKELGVAANRIFLNSAVDGNVKLMGDEITLGPKARLGGNLQYRGEDIEISPGAVITGTRSILPADEHDEFERWGKGSAAFFAGFAIAALLGVTLLVVVIALVLPRLMNKSSELIKQKPILSLGVGFLATFVLPFTLFLLFVTIVGAPLAMLIAAMLFAFTPVGVAASAYFIGMQGRRIIRKPAEDVPPPSRGSRLLWSAIAIVLIVALGMIPFVGGLIWLLILMFGMGAILVQGGLALARDS